MENDNNTKAGSGAFPRRNRVDLQTPVEQTIRNAVDAVEKLPADTRLTEAVILLDQAREKVADYIDEQIQGTSLKS